MSDYTELKLHAVGDNILYTPYLSSLKSKHGLIASLTEATAQNAQGQMSYMLGRVLSVGPDVSNIKPGDVVCLTAHTFVRGVLMYNEAKLTGRGSKDEAASAEFLQNGKSGHVMCAAAKEVFAIVTDIAGEQPEERAPSVAAQTLQVEV